MNNKGPVSIGSAGLGGYAGVISRCLGDSSLGNDPPVHLAAVCEPDQEQHAVRIAELRAEGVQVFASFDELLALPLESVWLPLPIPLHRPYTEMALAAGKAVMCEKPAAGCVQDLDAMRAARDRAHLPVAIGFQDIYEPSTQAVKQALLEGEIGVVQSAVLTACWPRDSHYYARSAWAGRQKQNGIWVMDSPASNALAHFVNLALFLLGADAGASALPVLVEAELYRVNPIENYDTCGLRITTERGVPFLALLTHACRETRAPRLVISGDRGTLTYVAGQSVEIAQASGARTLPLQPATRTAMVERFAQLVRGREDARPVATLEIARAHLAAINGASEAAAVHAVPASFVDVSPSADGGTLRAIAGIESVFESCAGAQRLPHELGSVPWSVPAGRRDLRGYTHFSGPAGAKD